MITKEVFHHPEVYMTMFRNPGTCERPCYVFVDNTLTDMITSVEDGNNMLYALQMYDNNNILFERHDIRRKAHWRIP